MDDSHPLDYYPDEETGDERTDSLALIDKARTFLAQAETLADIGTVREIAERARRYASAAKLGWAAENHAARLRIEAERKAGALLAETPKNPGTRTTTGGVIIPPPVDTPKLADLGVSKQQAKDWQRIARVPDEVFEAHVEEVIGKGEPLTTAGVVQVARRIEKAERLAEVQPAPLVIPPQVLCAVADARSLPLADESVHLIVTSPPYNARVNYDGYEDWLPWEEYWHGLIEPSLRECYRVLATGGRIALNIANVIRIDQPTPGRRGRATQYQSRALGGRQDLSNDPTWPLMLIPRMWALLEEIGFLPREHLTWVKGDDPADIPTRSTAWGTFASATNPVLRATSEPVLIASKGSHSREPGESDLTADEFKAWTRNAWFITTGHRDQYLDHPAMFPLELPRRLIKLYSYVGDVVLDPFVGSGTTALAATQLGRQAIGFDRSQKYVDSTLRRLAAHGRGPATVGETVARSGVRDEGAAEVLAGGLCGRLHRGAGGAQEQVGVPAGDPGVAV